MRGLQAPYVEAAVDAEDFADETYRLAACEPRQSVGHVFGIAPARDGQQASLDKAVVFFGDRGGHVGLDYDRTDFVDRDDFAGGATGEKFGQHEQGVLGDAVFGALGRAGVGGQGDDVDYDAAGKASRATTAPKGLAGR